MKIKLLPFRGRKLVKALDLHNIICSQESFEDWFCSLQEKYKLQENENYHLIVGSPSLCNFVTLKYIELSDVRQILFNECHMDLCGLFTGAMLHDLDEVDIPDRLTNPIIEIIELEIDGKKIEVVKGVDIRAALDIKQEYYSWKDYIMKMYSCPQDYIREIADSVPVFYFTITGVRRACKEYFFQPNAKAILNFLSQYEPKEKPEEDPREKQDRPIIPVKTIDGIQMVDAADLAYMIASPGTDLKDWIKHIKEEYHLTTPEEYYEEEETTTSGFRIYFSVQVARRVCQSYEYRNNPNAKIIMNYFNGFDKEKVQECFLQAKLHAPIEIHYIKGNHVVMTKALYYALELHYSYDDWRAVYASYLSTLYMDENTNMYISLNDAIPLCEDYYIKGSMRAGELKEYITAQRDYINRYGRPSETPWPDINTPPSETCTAASTDLKLSRNTRKSLRYLRERIFSLETEIKHLKTIEKTLRNCEK